MLLLSLTVEFANAQSVYLEWTSDPDESMVINWIDASGGNTSIDFRTEGSNGWSSENGNSRSIPGSSQRVYTVKLDDLSSGRGYEFRVGGNNEIYKFRTAPTSLEDPIRFLVAGDLLDDPLTYEQAKIDFQKVSVHAAAADPYFVAVGGDLAHAEGNKQNLVHHWFDLFELWHDNMITDDGYMIPIVAAVGNNEVPNNFGAEPEDAVYFFTFFRYPQDQWGSKISYGKLDFSNYLSIITLDSDHAHRVAGTQTNWLKNTLKNRSDFRHVIPVYHVAAWPTTRTFRGTQEDKVRDNWHPAFRENGVRLAFEHHDHVYKRTLSIGDCEVPITNELKCQSGSSAKDGVIYMGGGAWGSDNDRNGNNRWYINEMTEKVHNFVIVEISNNYRRATAIGENGQELDSFTDYVFLDPPEVLPTEIADRSFTAKWEEVEGAEDYLFTIFTDEDSDNIFRDFDNKNIGDVTELEVDNLDPSVIYYFNVRAKNVLTASTSSETVPVQLVKIDPDLSSLSVSRDTLVADDVENATITATVFDEDGELVPNFRLELFTVEGKLEAVDETVTTNDDGVAEFIVFNDRAGITTYGVLAGQEEITQKVQITFLPAPPVSLAATEVTNHEFTANWEVVEGTDYYVLDVATDDGFSNIVSGYQGLDVGNVTSQEVTGLSPGTEYFYRIRAITDDLTGINSETISTVTFPDTPTAVDASDHTVVSFNANWDSAEGAANYRLDAARDPNFEDILEDYNNVDVGNVLTYKIGGLLPGREYYYRVRSEAEPRLSERSNIVSATTLQIDTESSEIQPEQLRVLANGIQPNKIEVTIVGEDGNIQEDVPVRVIAENGDSEIEEVQPKTDDQGTAIFEVTNATAEKVTYRVEVADITIGSVELEFLTNEGVLTLGNNFPNPFRFNSAIPLTIPESMHVELRVFNSLGAPVRTLLNEEVETGYYEVPFNGADLAAGVYFYRLITNQGTKTGKMVLVK